MAYAAMTWSEIRNRLRQRTESVPFYTDDEALIAFNEALRLFNLLTGRFKRRETLPTVASQLLYTLSASMLYRMRMDVNGYPVVSSSREGLNLARPGWRSETTTSGGDVPTRPLVFVPVSLRTFYLWPADAAGGLTLTIDGVAATPVLVEDGDFLNLGEEHLNLLLGFALHCITFSKGGPFFTSTQDLFRAFLAGCAEENSQIKTSQVYRRVMGLDRRDLKPLRGAPLLQTVGGGSGGGLQ